MCRIVIALCLIFTLLPVFSQRNELDSLNNILDKSKNQKEISGTLLEIAKIYKNIKPDTSIALASRSMEIAYNINDTILKFKLLNFLGITYAEQGEYVKSMNSFIKGYEVSKDIKNDVSYATSILSNMARIYYIQGKHDKALELLREVYQIDEKAGNITVLGTTLNNMGVIYNKTKQYEKALEVYRKSLKLPHNTDSTEAATYANIASVYLEMGEYKKGLEMCETAIDLVIKAGNKEGLCVVWLKKATIYYKLKQYNDAINALEISLKTAKENNYQLSLYDGYQLMAEICKDKKDYKQAFEAYQKFIYLKDSILGENRLRELSELETQFGLKFKTEKIEQLKKEKLLNQKILYWAIVAAALFGIGLILTYFLFSFRNKLLKKANHELYLQQKATTLENEKLQLDIDFKSRQMVGNTLMIAQKNEVLYNIKENLEKITPTLSNEQNLRLKEVCHYVNSNLELTDDWEQIKLHFDNVHPTFFENLNKTFPFLTVHEQKLCVYLRMKLSNKEISRLLNIAPESVKVLKYRLKKKMQIEAEENMQEVLSQF